MSKTTVWRWWDRFLVEGVDGLLHDIPRRRGRKPISGDKISELIALAMSPPPEHASNWTLRALAKKLGTAVSTVSGILKHNRLKPHRVRTFRVSRDPRFGLRVRDVVGLHVDPPDHAMVITVDGSERVNAVEGFLSRLPRRRLRHAILSSLDECIAATEDYIKYHNANDARPFRWSREPKDPVEAWEKGHQKLQESES